MEIENIYDKIREILGEMPGNLNILEERIDIDLQMEYFDYSRKIKNNLDQEFIIQNKDDIFNHDLSEETRKKRFAELASVDNVLAYRTIEKYVKSQETDLRSWAILALQESRMLLESKLLDENQVFISTGLGGKGSRLRYFIVLILKSGKEFTALYKKVIKNEFEIITQKYSAEIERLTFFGNYATLTIIIPLEVPIKEMLKKSIRECNQYGNFLRTHFIVTNVKELSEKEIDNFLIGRKQISKDNCDESAPDF